MCILFAFGGCSDSGGGDSASALTPVEYTSAPAVIPVEDLPDSGATASPADGDEAVVIYKEAIGAINTEAGISNSVISRKINRKSRVSDSGTYPISVRETVNNGTITYDGFMKYYTRYPDDNFEPKAGKTYNDLVSVQVNMEIDGEVDDCPLEMYSSESYSYETYIVNGESKERLYYDESDSYTIPSDFDGTSLSSVRVSLDLIASLAYSASYSIKRASDGKGGKFTISYYGNVENTISGYYYDLLLSDDDPFTEMIYGITAVLRVYDDANNLVLTTNVPISELSGNISSSLDDM